MLNKDVKELKAIYQLIDSKLENGEDEDKVLEDFYETLIEEHIAIEPDASFKMLRDDIIMIASRISSHFKSLAYDWRTNELLVSKEEAKVYERRAVKAKSIANNLTGGQHIVFGMSPDLTIMSSDASFNAGLEHGAKIAEETENM